MSNINAKKIIGISGLARSGKNLFCDIAIQELNKRGYSAKQYALAYFLKKDCEQFVREKLNLNVFSENTDEKSIFREFLVWYGGVKRKQTEGQYWTSLLYKEIENDPSDVIFVSDIRYVQYPKDEVYWIQKELSGKLVHLSKYTLVYNNDAYVRRYVEPPNEHERINDPIIKGLSDYTVEWQDISSTSNNAINLKECDYLKDAVNKCLDSII
jgi:hypothetical protein